MSTGVVFKKAHVPGHVRKGKWVSTYETSAPSAKQNAKPSHPSLFSGVKPKKTDVHHPDLNDSGKMVPIYSPSSATGPGTWLDPAAVAVAIPGGHIDLPPELNGIRFSPWLGAPVEIDEWADVPGQMLDLVEPKLSVPKGRKAAAGVVIHEDDGRIWLVDPTNAFGGYESSFPKGTVEPDISLQANAIKEAFEETGLQVEITGLLGDYDRSTSVSRFYHARRVGGTPADMGWESQSVRLVPPGMLYEFLNQWPDHSLAEDLTGLAAPDSTDDLSDSDEKD
jgi:ADP-ribose pyrophosphatase YjhB (NUDIX family)